MGWISRRAWAALLVLVLVVMTTPSASATVPPGFDENNDVWSTAVPAASCRPGDRVETGLQGEVPLADRQSGRSTLGYACNIDLVGQYQGGTFARGLQLRGGQAALGIGIDRLVMLITGASGLLGQELCSHFKDKATLVRQGFALLRSLLTLWIMASTVELCSPADGSSATTSS